LSANETLQTLNISRNRLNGNDMQLLIKALRQRQQNGACALVDLNVMSNPLGRKGLAHVAVSLPTALKGLKRLHMLSTGNEEDEDGNDGDSDESLSTDADEMSLSFEMAEALDNLPLSLPGTL
ncbi:MAG: hypothetical protein SGARI_005436, partial [Bacillariaceae sp.]